MADDQQLSPIQPPHIAPQQGILLLQSQVKKGKNLLENQPLRDEDLNRWKLTARTALQMIFGTNASNVLIFANTAHPPGCEIETIKAKLGILESCIEQLEMYSQFVSSQTTSNSDQIDFVNAISNIYVFISYAHEDSEFAAQIADDLSALRIEYFLDRKEISWGQSIGQSVREALQRCSHQIIILSPASIKSPWVHFEAGFAFGSGKVALPFLSHPSLDIPSYFTDLLCKSRREDIKGYFQELLTDLQADQTQTDQ